jgi:hypothetical protein
MSIARLFFIGAKIIKVLLHIECIPAFLWFGVEGFFKEFCEARALKNYHFAGNQ